MDLALLKAKFRVGIGNPSTTDAPDTNATGTGLVDYINDAYTELADNYNHRVIKPRYQFTTVDGTDKYTLPSNIGAVLKAWDRTNKMPLLKADMDYVSKNEFDNPSPAKGKPSKWLPVDNYLQIIPIPDGAYKIEFQARLIVTPLAVDADIPILPTTWHRGILLLAKWHYFLDAQDLPRAAAAEAMFKRWVSNKPLEADEEKMSADVGVVIPTLSEPADKGLDFDHSE